MEDNLRKVRESLRELGYSELKTRQATEDLQELFQERQLLIEEMALAKQVALAEIDERYQARLADIEITYANILTLTAR
jgi:hypothetical protein